MCSSDLLMRFRKLDMSLKDQRQALVDTFINSIYLYDDKVLITFNYKEGTQTITFEEAAQAASKENGSDLDCFTAPRKTSTQCVLVFLFRCGRGLEQGGGAQRSELDYLIYNDPLAYAELILNGEPEEYLRNVAGSHGLED